MYLGTSLALLGSEVGLALGSRQSERPGLRPAAADPELWRTIFYASTPIVVLVSFLISRSTPSVFTAVYGSQFSEGYFLGNTQNIAIICLLSMFVAMHKVDVKHGVVVFTFLALVFLIWALFIRGFRQDVVTTLFGFAICYRLVRGRPSRLSIATIGALIAALTVALVVLELMGVARGMFAVNGMTFGEIWTEFASTLLNAG